MTHSDRKPKQPGGRPTNYRPEIGHQIADGMATGLSLEAAAASCGVGPRTVFTWQGQHEEFRQAVDDGRARSLLFWERRAIALASGEAGNAAVITLGLKNRSRAANGWHDAQRLEHSGPDGGAVQVLAQPTVIDSSSLTWEQRQALREILLTAVGEHEKAGWRK